MGELAGFSFYPGKNLGAYGDGGAVASRREDLALRVRQLGDHGSPEKFRHDLLGTNSRLDAMQAAVLRVKLRHLDAWNEQRRAAAAAYGERLEGVGDLFLPQVRPEHSPVYHLYVIRSKKVKEIDAALRAAEIGFGYHYPVPVHLQAPFRELGEPGSFPEAEAGAGEILSLPMYAEIGLEQIDSVCETLTSVF